MKSWLTGKCINCDYPVVVTQAVDQSYDYCWYCSNPSCWNHSSKEDTYDSDKPEWVNLKGERITPIRMGK